MEAGPDSKPPKMPTWVKVFLVIGVAFVALLIGVLVLGGSEHGPGRHGGSRDGNSSGEPTGSHSPPTTHHAASNGDFSPKPADAAIDRPPPPVAPREK